eukprot:PhM_4_TR17666/c0_g1_i1/m.39670
MTSRFVPPWSPCLRMTFPPSFCAHFLPPWVIRRGPSTKYTPIIRPAPGYLSFVVQPSENLRRSHKTTTAASTATAQAQQVTEEDSQASTPQSSPAPQQQQQHHDTDHDTDHDDHPLAATDIINQANEAFRAGAPRGDNSSSIRDFIIDSVRMNARLKEVEARLGDQQRRLHALRAAHPTLGRQQELQDVLRDMVQVQKDLKMSKMRLQVLKHRVFYQ